MPSRHGTPGALKRNRRAVRRGGGRYFFCE
jgi:hypothetical protein